jgi:regulator of replication initiation timing
MEAQTSTNSTVPRRCALTDGGSILTIGVMNEEINQLAARIAALTEFNRRLAAQNNHLKGQLAEAERHYAQAQERLESVRGKVENALSRLPMVADN